MTPTRARKTLDKRSRTKLLTHICLLLLAAAATLVSFGFDVTMSFKLLLLTHFECFLLVLRWERCEVGMMAAIIFELSCLDTVCGVQWCGLSYHFCVNREILKMKNLCSFLKQE
jgi:hypothetical protein